MTIGSTPTGRRDMSNRREVRRQLAYYYAIFDDKQSPYY